MTRNDHDASLLRAFFAAARTLEPTDGEVAQVLSRAKTVRRPARLRAAHGPNLRATLRRLAPVGLAALVLLAGAYATASPVRAALDDVTGTFAAWLSGDADTAPGRALGADEDAPDYFRDGGYGDPRVIAEADGYKLYAARVAGGGVEFNLGDTGVGLGEVSADVFRDQVLFVLGPGGVRNADEHGHVPLFGITARPVKSVELRYDSGPPLRVDRIEGGFVLLAEPDRSPSAVIAFDGRGREIGRALVDDSSHFGPRIDWTQYGPPSPRVPAECLPGAAGATPPPQCPPR
jgi:hypothetical protein